MISRKEYSPLKANLWSCGIVLYTMLCGFLPFEHENTAQLYKLAEKGIYE
jgi:5'-AMP-activated protein kinase catalytic alpha subunit